MLSGARAVVPLAALSILVLLTVAVGDGVRPAPRVALAYEGLLASVPSAELAPVAPVLPSPSEVTTILASSSDEQTSPTPAAPEPTADPAQAPAPVVPVAAPRTLAPAPTPRTVPSAPPSATPSATCPVDWFCYPRVGVSGPIVPYSDCLGGSDIGTSIRAFTCLSPRYLLGHAYTQFGKITQWQAGDLVWAYGQPFHVTGAVTARSCESPPLPLAPLSMQTSLSSSGCGSVLIVQAR